jgi:NADP-dependent 3-hydroxy acid dehydrogenase YdfG
MCANIARGVSARCHNQPLRTVVVTGVSTGIGAATARVLTTRGLRVFGSVRGWR